MGWTCWLLGHSKNYEDDITKVGGFGYRGWKCLRCGETGKAYLGMHERAKGPHQ